MRIPWQAPTIGDATKMGLVKAWSKNAIGPALYELLLQPIFTEAFSNLSSWTRVSLNTIRVYDYTVDMASLVTASDVGVRKDYGASYFGNFTHDFDLKLVTAPQTPRCVVWALESTAARTDADMLANNTGIGIIWNKAVTNHIITLYNYVDDTNVTYDLGNATTNTQLYCRINRTGTDGTLTFYTTAARTSEITHVHLTVPNTAYRYLFALASPEAAGTAVSWQLANLAITSGGSAIAFNADATWPILESSETTDINLSGGVLTINGNGTAIRNGLFYGNPTGSGLAGTSDFCLKFDYKHFSTITLNSMGLLGVQNLWYTAAISNCHLIRDQATRLLCYGKKQYMSCITYPALTANGTYTLRCYGLKNYAGNMRACRITIEGGTEYPIETQLFYGDNSDDTALGAQWPSFSQTTDNDTIPLTISNLVYSTGYATTTLTYVADAGVGRKFGGLKFSMLANGGWATTNATFKWSYDTAGASWSAAKTWANLLLETELTTKHRYIRLQIIPDGTAQQYAGEVNADDATSIFNEQSGTWVS